MVLSPYHELWQIHEHADGVQPTNGAWIWRAHLVERLRTAMNHVARILRINGQHILVFWLTLFVMGLTNGTGLSSPRLGGFLVPLGRSSKNGTEGFEGCVAFPRSD